MSPQNTEDCLFATQIASLFYGLLLTSLASDPPPGEAGIPSIETQAYFERLVTSTHSAECNLSKYWVNSEKKYEFWRKEVLGSADLRKLRNCMIHSAYTKVSGDQWMVKPFDKADGDDRFKERSLDGYAQIAFRYANYLESLITNRLDTGRKQNIATLTRPTKS